jgi:hypothetical protein
MYPIFLLFGLAVLFLAASCGTTKVKTTEKYSGKLPRPDRILVYDFAASPDEIKLDTGLSADIARAVEGKPRTADELKIGHAAAGALAKELVKGIQGFGLPAERAAGIPPTSGNTLLIHGQLLSIDQGNRTERVVIGLGAGRTSVKANVQVYEMTAEGKQKVEQLQADAKSGRKPGMAEMMGIGAVAGTLATSAAVSGTVSAAGEASWETVEADARRLAKKVAKELGQFFVEQGWMPAGGAKNPSSGPNIHWSGTYRYGTSTDSQIRFQSD